MSDSIDNFNTEQFEAYKRWQVCRDMVIKAARNVALPDYGSFAKDLESEMADLVLALNCEEKVKSEFRKAIETP